jgi:hypothetical protein
MRLVIEVDPSWFSHPAALVEFVSRARLLERPAAATSAPPATPPPPSSVAPAEDPDDVSMLISGMDTEEPEAPAPSRPMLAPSPIPRSGQALYRWACRNDLLPKCNAIGKARGWPKMLTQWSSERVAEAYAELTASASTNGRAR